MYYVLKNTSMACFVNADGQLSSAGVYSLLNYSGPQSVIINRLHSTFGAHCRAEKKRQLFLWEACGLTSEESKMGQWFRREEVEKILGRGTAKEAFLGVVVFIVAVVQDKSWGRWGN